MPLDEVAGSPAVTIDPDDDYRVVCYVRSNVPGPVFERVEAVVDRLDHLRDRGTIDGYRLSRWPAGRHANAGTAARDGPTRAELVDAFERWAERHGHSIEPAFRREEIPSSPLGLGDGEPRERVRVPVLALALYDGGERTARAESDAERPAATKRPADPEVIRGVVPYTERPNAEEGRTYAVGEWLSAIETGGSGASARASRRDRRTRLEQRR